MQKRKWNCLAWFVGSIFKFIGHIIFIVDMSKYIFASPIAYTGFYFTMLEPYYIFSGQTPHLYLDGNMSNPDSFRRAESVFFFAKYDQPIHLILHKP